MGEFDKSYQWKIDMMLEYRKQYEDAIIEGEHLIVQNRVREAYLGEVNMKILQLERECGAMNKAKSGLEMVIMHQTFNGHAPFSWGRDGTDSRPSMKVEVLPKYKEVLQINIDVINEFKAATHMYPKYMVYELIDNKLCSRFGEVYTYRLGQVRENEIDFLDYNALKSKLYDYIPHYIGEGDKMEVFHCILPHFSSNDSNLNEPFHEWSFEMRCNIIRNR